MTDLVIFAGPVMLRPDTSKIDWYGDKVAIALIQGSGSENFKKLALGMKDSQGRILPTILRKYAAGLDSIDRIALCAYSAGHGLVNQVGLVDEDRAAISACCLSDAAFIGNTSPTPQGLVNWAADGALGKRLFAATSSLGKGETYLSGRDSVAKIWSAASKQSGFAPVPTTPRSPIANGTWQRMGQSAVWGDIPELTHGQHHDYHPVLWQAYLAAYWAGKFPNPIATVLSMMSPLVRSVRFPRIV